VLLTRRELNHRIKKILPQPENEPPAKE
jgi:hypothetical protein